MRPSWRALAVGVVLVIGTLPGRAADDTFVCSTRTVARCTQLFVGKTVANGCDLEKTRFAGPEGGKRLRECLARAEEDVRHEAAIPGSDAASCPEVLQFARACALYSAAVAWYATTRERGGVEWENIDPLLEALVGDDRISLDAFQRNARTLLPEGGEAFARRIEDLASRKVTLVLSGFPAGTRVVRGGDRGMFVVGQPEERIDVEAGEHLVISHPCYRAAGGDEAVFDVPANPAERELRLEGKELLRPVVTLRVEVAGKDVHPRKVSFDGSPWQDVGPFLGRDGVICYDHLRKDLADGQLTVRFQGEGMLSWDSLELTIPGEGAQHVQLPPGGIAVLVVEEDLLGAEQLLVDELQRRWSWTGLPVSGLGVVSSLDEARRRLASGDYLLGLLGRRGTGSEDVYWQALHPVLAEAWIGERVRTVPSMDGSQLDGIEDLDRMLRVDLPPLVTREIPLELVEVPWREHPIVVGVLDSSVAGVAPGDELVAVDVGEEKPVGGVRELATVLRAAGGKDRVVVRLRGEGQDRTVSVPLVAGPRLLEELRDLPGGGLSGILFGLELAARTDKDPLRRYAARYNAFTILVGGAQGPRPPLAPMRRLRERLDAPDDEGCRWHVPGCNAVATYRNLRAALVGESPLDLGRKDWLNRPYGDSVAQHEIVSGHELPAGRSGR